MTNNKGSDSHQNKQVFYLTSEAILKYFLNVSDRIDTLVLCKSSEVKLTTTSQNLYEALGSLENYEGFKLTKLVKFLEVVDVEQTPRTILTHKKAEDLRKAALGSNDI